MAIYRYTAKDTLGVQQNGTLDAADEPSAIRSLQGRGLFILKLKRDSQKTSAAGLSRTSRRRVKLEDLVAFCSELSVLLHSGVKILRAFELLSEQIQSQALRDAVAQIHKDMEAGLPFSKAIGKHPKVFPDIWIYIVEAGEVSGHLPEVLKELGRYLEMRDNMGKKIISAMLYPAVLILVAMGAIVFFMLKIIPIFANLFKSFNAELPLLTRVVMNMSTFFSHAAGYIFVVLFVGGYFLQKFLRTPAGQRAMDTFLLTAPMISGFVRDTILARISINLAVLIKSGVDFIKSLQITSRIAGNSYYRDALLQVLAEVKEGKAASEAMRGNPLFSNQMVQMVQIGEESGQLDVMLGKLGDYYENRINVFIGRLNVLIEPVILLFVGVVIGFLVVAMFLPIFSLSKVVR